MNEKTIERIKVYEKKIIIKDYYQNIVNQKMESVVDIWSDCNRKCTNLSEFMYNNPNQPNTDFAYKKNIGWTKVGYMEGSKCNQSQHLGSMKEIWKEFEKKHLKEIDFENLKIGDIEDKFWKFYTTHYKDKFENSLNMFQKYVKEKRSKMTEEERMVEEKYFPNLTDEKWIDGCVDYLENLVKVKTVRGFVIELLFFKSLELVLNGQFVESSIDYEKMGIDGFFVKDCVWYPVCLKPYTFKNGGVSPVLENRFVKYKQYKNDLVFEFVSGHEILKMKVA